MLVSSKYLLILVINFFYENVNVEVIFIYASTDSKPNVRVQDDSLQWKEVEYGIHADLKFKCVDLCL